jgi:indole-3-glycerol phosphate synthase
LLRLQEAGFDAVLIGEGLTLESDLSTYWKHEEETI